jgi:phosphatidylglycerol---prolipoprotein diacylglyceryl transferase
MFPYIHLGAFSIPAYGLILATAVLCSVWLAIHRAPQYGIDSRFAVQVTAYAVLAAIIGCRLGDAVIHPAIYWHSPRGLLHAGGTFLFGLLAGTLVVAWFAIRSGVSAWVMGDVGAPAFALGIAIGRLGCFAAGCDYGKPANLPWSVTFRNPVANQLSGTPLGIPLHPSQLYESFYQFTLFLLILYLSRRRVRPGAIIWTFALLYAAGRFVLEFFRGDADRGFWGPLSISQWLCVVFVFLLVVFHYIPRTHGFELSRPTPTSGREPFLLNNGLLPFKK